MLLQLFKTLPGEIGAQIEETGRAAPPCGFRPIQFVDVMPRTFDEKVDLFPDALESEAPSGLYTFQPDPASERFPLALISPASDKTISSTLGELPRPAVRLLMNPADGAARGLKDGDPIRVFNELGEVQCAVKIEATIREGTVSLPKGLWRKSTWNQMTANVLVPDSLTDLGAGACFNDARVQVAPSGRKASATEFHGKMPSSSYTIATLLMARTKAAVRRSPISGRGAGYRGFPDRPRSSCLPAPSSRWPARRSPSRTTRVRVR